MAAVLVRSTARGVTREDVRIISYYKSETEPFLILLPASRSWVFVVRFCVWLVLLAPRFAS
jgi:hypothetical protein